MKILALSSSPPSVLNFSQLTTVELSYLVKFWICVIMTFWGSGRGSVGRVFASDQEVLGSNPDIGKKLY